MVGIEVAFLDHLPPEPRAADARARLPGYPDIGMENTERLSAFLMDELTCTELDEISLHLWIMSTQSSANISPLHRQAVKGREIVLTEEPKIHLVWFYDRIYIKPMPRYLLSRGFWQDCLLSRQEPLGDQHQAILRSALGFLRSYTYLIRYESDLRVAQDKTLALIPDFMSWEQWCLLRREILAVRDEEVSGRFRFGEIRLTRLNFYCKFLLGKAYYHRTHRQYGDYFASFYPPLVFLFGLISTMLTSMQLMASIEQIHSQSRGLRLLRTFSAMIIGANCLLIAALMIILASKIAGEWTFALRCRYSPKQRQ